jgi:hypothetical protein
MSRYLYGLIWNSGISHFDFIYNIIDNENTYTINTQNLETIDKSKLTSVTLNNIQVNTLNNEFCELPFTSLIINCCKINSIENLHVNKNLKKLIIVDSDIIDIQKLTDMNITNITDAKYKKYKY